MSSVFEDMNESEKQVADFLSSIGLWWKYEHPVFVYDKKERPRVWTPDFYLPKMGIYILKYAVQKISIMIIERSL